MWHTCELLSVHSHVVLFSTLVPSPVHVIQCGFARWSEWYDKCVPNRVSGRVPQVSHISVVSWSVSCILLPPSLSPFLPPSSLHPSLLLSFPFPFSFPPSLLSFHFSFIPPSLLSSLLPSSLSFPPPSFTPSPPQLSFTPSPPHPPSLLPLSTLLHSFLSPPSVTPSSPHPPSLLPLPTIHHSFPSPSSVTPSPPHQPHSFLSFPPLLSSFLK